MTELEQRNKELSALLKSSENSRTEMQTIMQEQNNELATLRANSLILETIEQEVRVLKDYKIKFQEQAKILDGFRKQEQILQEKVAELEAERGETTMHDHQNKMTTFELMKKLTHLQDLLVEKEETILKTENTVKVLLDKCNILGVNNKDIKEELKARTKCHIESENNFKEFSKTIQFCKSHLQKEIENLTQELQLERSAREEMCVELGTLQGKVKDYEKQLSEDGNRLVFVQEELRNKENIINDYETGVLQSESCINELQKLREQEEVNKNSYDARIDCLQNEIDSKYEENKRLSLLQDKLKSDLNHVQSKVRYYEEHYVKKEDVDLIKNELELKYKLEMNKQLQRASATFEQEQGELLQTMRASLAHKSKLKEPTIDSRPLNCRK